MRAAMRFELYQHDSPEAFRLVVKGGFYDAGAAQVELALKAARPTLIGRLVIVDVSEVSGVDDAALAFLRQMAESGVHIIARQPPKCAELLHLLDLEAPLLPACRRDIWPLRWLRTLGLP